MYTKLIHLLFAVLSTALPFCETALTAPPPNVIFILSDDQGWNDIGYHNPELRTPHLDQLAREGVELDAHYVQPQCTPTRVALLTGRYPSRFGTHCLVASTEQAIPLGTPTLATLFQSKGYATALCGKWHLGSKPEYGPNHYGFEHSYGLLSGAVGVYDHRYRLGTPYEKSWHRNLVLFEEEGNVMDLITREAVQWIESHRDAPYFLYVPFTAAHTPIVPKEEWLSVNAHIADEERRMYAAVLSQLDDSVGKIVAALDATGQRENTLVVYSSDNGAQVDHSGNAYPGPDPALTKFSSNLPLRGKKTQAYEGGIRVPAFANWPGRLSARKVSAPMHMVDWMPTFAKLIGADAPAGVLDGVELWPVLNGDGESTAERVVYQVWGKFRQWEALRLGDWKMVRNRGKQGDETPWELYQLAVDPNETKNLATAHPEKLQELKERFAAERAKDALK